MSGSDGSSYTGAKRKKPGTFEKGDHRINRSGRPRNFDAARAIFQAVAHEMIKDKNGNELTVIEAIARKWAVSSEPTLQKAFVEYCFGKVPDRIAETDSEGKDKQPMVIQLVGDQITNGCN